MLGAIGAMEMGGDIWSTGAFAYDSPLKDILDSGDFTIAQLLAEDELLQEIRGCNQQLLDAFGTVESVTLLIQYVIRPPGDAVVEPNEWLRHHLEAPPAQTNEENKTLLKDPDYQRVRLPYMACEVLCSEIASVLDILVSTDHVVAETNGENDTSLTPPSSSLLDLLFSVLHDTPSGELDNYRAGYLDKILTIVSRKKPVPITEYINSGGRYGRTALMQSLVRHLYSHSIMQIAQQLLLPHRPRPPPTNESSNGGGDEIVEAAEEDVVVVQCNWGDSPEILDMLLQTLISDSLPLSLNASDVLITIIQNSLLSSPILLSLTEPATLLRLVDASSVPSEEDGGIFQRCESILTSAMNVLESLILQLGGYGAVGNMTALEDDEERPNNIFAEEEEEQEEPQRLADVSSLKEHLPILLQRYAGLLLDPICATWTSTTQFSRDVPVQMLGTSRLRIVRVVESLVLLGDPEVDEQLMASDCLRICLDMFWEFQWCSMLHQSVANLLVHVLEGQNVRQAIQAYFLQDCNLLDRLMNSFQIEEEAEEEEVATAADESSSSVPHLPPQTFRYGYMGHVIIVCQALVHAYSPHDEDDEEEVVGDDQHPSITPASTTETDGGGPSIMQATPIIATPSNDDDDMDTSIMPTDEFGEPLILFDLVCNHPASDRWHDFCETTLSTETAIQSITLGGFPIQQQLQHRPGLVDEGNMMGDDGDGPPAPPRGSGVPGVLANMDENDMDIAASMMEVLNAVGAVDDNGSNNSGSSGDTIDSSRRQGYAFDDPLGRAGSLGIELGRLTQYQLGGEEGKAEDEGEDGSHSSSDEEPETAATSDDVRVMDLFTGNFNYDAEATDFADFADFGSAAMSGGGGIDTDDDFGPFARPPNPSPSEDSDPFAEILDTKKVSIDDIFGEGDHAELLELPDSNSDEAFVEVGAVGQPPAQPEQSNDTALVFESGESIATLVGTAHSANAPEETPSLTQELARQNLDAFEKAPEETPDLTQEFARLAVDVEAQEISEVVPSSAEDPAGAPEDETSQEATPMISDLDSADAAAAPAAAAADLVDDDVVTSSSQPETDEETKQDDEMLNTVDREPAPKTTIDEGEPRSQSDGESGGDGTC